MYICNTRKSQTINKTYLLIYTVPSILLWNVTQILSFRTCTIERWMIHACASTDLLMINRRKTGKALCTKQLYWKVYLKSSCLSSSQSCVGCTIMIIMMITMIRDSNTESEVSLRPFIIPSNKRRITYHYEAYVSTKLIIIIFFLANKDTGTQLPIQKPDLDFNHCHLSAVT